MVLGLGLFIIIFGKLSFPVLFLWITLARASYDNAFLRTSVTLIMLIVEVLAVFDKAGRAFACDVHEAA